MKLYKFVTIPLHTKKEFDGYQCDWCQNKIEEVELPDVSEFEIKDEIGICDPDGGGESEIKSFDLCVSCRLHFWDLIKNQTSIKVQIEDINV